MDTLLTTALINPFQTVSRILQTYSKMSSLYIKTLLDRLSSYSFLTLLVYLELFNYNACETQFNVRKWKRKLEFAVNGPTNHSIPICIRYCGRKWIFRISVVNIWYVFILFISKYFRLSQHYTNVQHLISFGFQL